MILKSKYLLMFIGFILEVGVICDKRENEEFIATNYWQPIKKGQKVPSGLHYRINLQTGITEAILMEEDEKKSERTDILKLSTKDEENLNPEELKEALKKIKNDDSKTTGKKKHNFRTYEQLKEELGNINLSSKTDGEIIQDLLKQHKKEIKKDEIDLDLILNILEDMNYLGHQYDNALEFVRQNVFRDVIYINLNSSYDIVRQNTLKLFGSIVQNNAKVQIHALETGSMPILLRFLSHDNSEITKSNAVFALGCLLRRFPLAQHTFIKNGGVYVILQMFEKDSIKLQLKIVTLMTDLFLEKKHALEGTNKMLFHQYKVIPIDIQLIYQNWCDHVSTLLFNIVDTSQDDHDSVDKCLTALEVVGTKCNSVNRQLLETIKDKYTHLAQMDTDGDDFFTNIVRICSSLLNVREKSEL